MPYNDVVDNSQLCISLTSTCILFTLTTNISSSSIQNDCEHNLLTSIEQEADDISSRDVYSSTTPVSYHLLWVRKQADRQYVSLFSCLSFRSSRQSSARCLSPLGRSESTFSHWSRDLPRRWDMRFSCRFLWAQADGQDVPLLEWKPCCKLLLPDLPKESW